MRLKRLDGIRAIAILLVIFFHEGYISLGWVGVDLFFVLSGFFITQILRKTRSDSFYWSSFYTRRAARILPPLLLVIALSCIFTKHVRWPMVLGYTFFVGNVVNIRGIGHVLLNPLWSLAVEEQFYLIWPFMVLLFNRRTLLVLLSAILVLEPVLRALASPHFGAWQPIYYLTPFRIDTLAAGSLMALLTEDDTFPAVRWSGWLALALGTLLLSLTTFVPSFHRLANSVLFNSLGYSLVCWTALMFIVWVESLEGGVAYNLLSWEPLSYIGRISYSMYLVHVPILFIVQTKRHIHSWLLDLTLTVAAASLSYRFVEKPIIAKAKTLIDPKSTPVFYI